MTAISTNPLEQFHWTPQPAAEQLVKEIVEEVLHSCPHAKQLQNRMRDEAGVRLIDCIDHLAVGRSRMTEDQLLQGGFERSNILGGSYAHPGGIFPQVILKDANRSTIYLKVESVVDFSSAFGQAVDIIGAPGSAIRIGIISDGIAVLERHGYRGPEAGGLKVTDAAVRQTMVHSEAFRLRRRDFPDDAQGFAHAHELIDASIRALGADHTCELFFAAEREYWQRRNRAAQFQKARQDRLGLGWANHDHHTYRSSRKYFSQLVGICEKLGFACRERFYAGADAGWGAQVLEQSNAGIVVFADVDLSPDELFNDFAHDPLPDRQQLGTVGLWCALHGEAFLQAGMHHLECQFDFDALKNQLKESAGIHVMKPFTDFPYLRQAFTEGERWPVAERRIKALLNAKQITAAQAEQFRTQGAIGSHLENLERNQGFKGFNQKGVSEIIAKTDPRHHLSAH